VKEQLQRKISSSSGTKDNYSGTTKVGETGGIKSVQCQFSKLFNSSQWNQAIF
jgi:hypothetical protein